MPVHPGAKQVPYQSVHVHVLLLAAPGKVFHSELHADGLIQSQDGFEIVHGVQQLGSADVKVRVVARREVGVQLRDASQRLGTCQGEIFQLLALAQLLRVENNNLPDQHPSCRELGPAQS